MASMSDAGERTVEATRMRRGMIWLVAGSGLLIGTYALATNDVNRILAYGLLALGLYLVILGVEKMLGGYLAGARSGDPETVRSVRRAGAVCLLLVVIVGAGGSYAYFAKVPYWRSIESIAAGMDVGSRFIDIIERHSESLESGVAGEEALGLWKDTAEAGLAMRDRMIDAHEGAVYLSEHAGGDLQMQAESIEPFYSVCVEWIRFYERIDRAFREESMIEPRPDWADEHERLHQKIHDVQPHAIEGS